MPINQDFEEKFGQYLFRWAKEKNISLEQLNNIQQFWTDCKVMLSNEYLDLARRFADEQTKRELINIGDIIYRDPHIKSKDENVQRIIEHMSMFIQELDDEEIDYSDDREDLGGEVEAASPVDQVPPAES